MLSHPPWVKYRSLKYCEIFADFIFPIHDKLYMSENLARLWIVYAQASNLHLLSFLILAPLEEQK